MLYQMMEMPMKKMARPIKKDGNAEPKIWKLYETQFTQMEISNPYQTKRWKLNLEWAAMDGKCVVKISAT